MTATEGTSFFFENLVWENNFLNEGTFKRPLKCENIRGGWMKSHLGFSSACYIDFDMGGDEITKTVTSQNVKLARVSIKNKNYFMKRG